MAAGSTSSAPTGWSRQRCSLGERGDDVLDDAEQRVELGRRPVEVVGREQPQRDHLDADLLAPLQQRLDVGGAGGVTLRGAGADRPGPAAVAVEHHPDVLGQLVLGQGVEHARLVRGVQDASDAFLPLSHGADANFNKMNEAVRSARESIAEQAVGETVAEIKPRLRGWLHLGSAPLTLAAGIVLIALSPTASTRIGSAVYVVSALLVFTVSAIYHRGRWSPRTHGFLKRFDHANIFLLIAGTYTPFALLLLDGTQRTVLLSGHLVGGRARRAVQGVLDRLRRAGSTCRSTSAWAGWRSSSSPASPRARATASASASARPSSCSSIAGGALYTVGGVVYGFKRPNPWPRWFGFHEVFHTFTILAFVTHYVGVSMATYALR